MLFQTFEYLLFFIVVMLVTFSVPRRWKKFVLLTASIFFYAYGSLLHTLLFIYIIFETYFLACLIDKKQSKILLAVGVIFAFIPLMIYKYIPFIERELFHISSERFIVFTLPIGISFYTFQAVGYLVDVYRKRMKAETDLISYALFLSFFPQLIAGPIERAENLLDQVKKNITFNYQNAANGFLTMGIGLFLKLFIAERLAFIVNLVYGNPNTSSGVTLLLATFFFGIQIYCDFNGYSTIAQGSAKVLGIELQDNFRQPYFSKSCTEFWHRWHISLSYWFRDYLYIPLGGNRCSKLRSYLNLFITFLVSGLWHGASWTFLAWGGINGIYQVIEKSLGLGKLKQHKYKIITIFRWLITYVLINLSWVFFRAVNLPDALLIYGKLIKIPSELFQLVSGNIAISSLISTNGLYIWNLGMSVIGIILLFMFSFYQEKRGSIVLLIRKQKPLARYALYLAILGGTLCFGVFSESSEFIYFRF